MVGKCANPQCSAKFRYLHKGKLFAFDPLRWPLPHKLHGYHARPKPEFRWLCQDCSRTMTVGYPGCRDARAMANSRQGGDVAATPFAAA